MQFLSGAHYRLGQLDEAINTIGKAAELDPQNADVLISYAYLLAEQGKAQAGFDMAQRAIALKPNPNNPLLQYALGVGYKAQGKTVEATTAFQGVINSTDAEPMLKDKARKQIE